MIITRVDMSTVGADFEAGQILAHDVINILALDSSAIIRIDVVVHLEKQWIEVSLYLPPYHDQESMARTLRGAMDDSSVEVRVL